MKSDGSVRRRQRYSLRGSLRQMDENSSCWIRVSCPWAGKGLRDDPDPAHRPPPPEASWWISKTAIRIRQRSSWGNANRSNTPCRRGDCREWRRRAGSFSHLAVWRANERQITCCGVLMINGRGGSEVPRGKILNTTVKNTKRIRLWWWIAPNHWDETFNGIGEDRNTTVTKNDGSFP
ncbi:hypothetical protein KCP73_06485 [Salmonella enterica subsp. enterica]|nr:hypothetical protein KCP73_06485 [Salmonella enterica subsp. enterica]